MAQASFQDLLRAQDDVDKDYVAFLRSTPEPDEPHRCWKAPLCILCELLEAREEYDEVSPVPWETTGATLISKGYHHLREPLWAFLSVEEGS